MALTSDERAKKIQLIRALLAKSADTGIPEPEQQVYRERARELMEKYAIADADTLEAARETPIVYREIIVDPTIRVDRSLFAMIPHIVHPIAQFFGCFAVVKVSDELRSSWIMGFEANVDMVEYAFNVVLRQGRTEYERLYRENRSITFGASFWEGFALGLSKKFAVPEKPGEVGLQLYDKVQEKYKSIVNPNILYGANIGGTVNERESGIKAGENVRLNKPIEHGDKGKLIG